MEGKAIKKGLVEIEQTQVWLIKKLYKKGIVVQPSEMSKILGDVLHTPKAERVLEVSAAIIRENGYEFNAK